MRKMNYKQRCKLELIIGLILIAASIVCIPFMDNGRNAVLTAFGFIFAISGAVIGRRSLRGLICIAAFNRRKSKELEKLEAIFSGGGISQEEYFTRKVKLLNSEYGDE